MDALSARRVGVAAVGLGGAVATTAVAGLELLRAGHTQPHGLPLSAIDATLTRALPSYEDLVFAGWDVCGDDLASAAKGHDVLSLEQFEAARPALAEMTPWPAVGNERFCHNVTGSHRIETSSLRAAAAQIQDDLHRFRTEQNLDGMVMVNLASTEAFVDPTLDLYTDPEAFEAALDADHEAISPAMLYAYAAITAGVPYVNFTPSVAADLPALTALAEAHGVPIAGKDGKTGQTFLKTVIAPGLRDRALRVEGWFSTNILGNRDGVALQDKDSLASKLDTKSSVLNQILGYPVEDHVVDISYYRPRGDNKEAWDNIDLVGFLGQKMQVKINFLCRDSILAAPLVIELARLADLAGQSGEAGVQEHLGVFFKSPMMQNGQPPEHDFPRQQQHLLAWLRAHQPAPTS